ncbi:MAG: hypothetical protein Q8O91_05765, partial [Candidatus Aminicenantes bacterium]|nr:hypothetical protein [Candidatus Aminicenantes bacterium]
MRIGAGGIKELLIAFQSASVISLLKLQPLRGQHVLGQGGRPRIDGSEREEVFRKEQDFSYGEADLIGIQEEKYFFHGGMLKFEFLQRLEERVGRDAWLIGESFLKILLHRRNIGPDRPDDRLSISPLVVQPVLFDQRSVVFDPPKRQVAEEEAGQNNAHKKKDNNPFSFMPEQVHG